MSFMQLARLRKLAKQNGEVNCEGVTNSSKAPKGDEDSKKTNSSCQFVNANVGMLKPSTSNAKENKIVDKKKNQS